MSAEHIRKNDGGHVLAEKSAPVEYMSFRFHGAPTVWLNHPSAVFPPSVALSDEQEERVVRSVVASQATAGVDARPLLGLPFDWRPGHSLNARRDPGAPRNPWELAQIHERLRASRVAHEGDGVHLPAVVHNAAFLSALVEASR